MKISIAVASTHASFYLFDTCAGAGAVANLVGELEALVSLYDDTV